MAGPLAWAAALSMLLAVGPLLPAARFFASPANYLPLHTLLEFVAMAVSAMVFTLGWNLRKQEGNSQAVLLGIAALSVLLIDLAHTLSYKGMPEFVTASSPEKAINFWLAGRLVAALSLLAVAFRPARQWSAWSSRLALGGSLALTALVWWVGLFHADWLPRTFVEGQGLTPFKVAAEYFLAAIYGAAALGLMWRARREHNPDGGWLAAAAWVLALAELFFTLYQDVTDLFNLLGHVYKTAAYIMVYRAIFVAGVTAPYEELKESERRLSQVMSATGEGVWDWHLESGFVYHNLRWCQILGLGERYLCHPLDAFTERIHAADREGLMARLQTCLDGQGRYYSEHRLLHADGHYLWVMDCGDVVERAPDGRALRMAGSIRDISELYEARLALENYRDHLEELVVERTREAEAARAEAEHLAQVKSEFLANMSHEIRTPMNAIIGMTELCLSTRPDERQQNYLDKIKLASDALLHIIDDILDFSKIEAGKLDISAEPFRLADVFDGIKSMLAERARAKGLSLVVPADGMPKLTLLGDPMRLGQVLVNLVGNAVKFSSHGQVKVSVSEEARDEGKVSLHFAVRDEGIGIGAEEQRRLFQPFSQADSSTTRRYGGTGLGLAISKRLVELMGGRIWVDSAPSRGSTFHFTVCLEVSDAPPLSHLVRGLKSVDSEVLARLSGADILLVEDTELNQEVISELLQHAGMRVRVAGNGEEALQAIAAAPPDCVLMDCQMPVMDGFEATRRLRAQPGYRNIPIIALTANVMSGDRERCVAAGMNGFLAKPVDLGELLATLARWVPAQHAKAMPAPPDTAPAEAADALPELAGIDTATGLHYLGGRLPAYVRVLKRFRDTRASGFKAAFAAARQAADPGMAERLAHSLKSSARTLGAGSLGDLAARLEEAAKAGDPQAVAECFEPVQAELERVLGDLEKLGA